LYFLLDQHYIILVIFIHQSIIIMNKNCNKNLKYFFIKKSLYYYFWFPNYKYVHNENIFANKLGPTFTFKTMDINHQSFPPSFELSNDQSKIMNLHVIIHIKKICWLNYVLVTMQCMMVLWMELMEFLKHLQNIVTKPSYE
jgi:hypothetical protein